MSIERTGFQQDNVGAWIPKDIEAELIYTFDWSEWLKSSDTISVVDYTVQVRANDPSPMVKLSEGVISGKYTYVELGGGNLNKIYTVTARVETSDGNIDRRSFRVKIENRSA